MGERCLGRAVGHPQGGRAQPGDRGDVDDRGALRGFQHRVEALRHQERPVEIGAHHLAPCAEVHVGHGPEPRKPRVVDQPCEVRPVARQTFRQVRDRGGLRDIGVEAPNVLQAVRRAAELRAIAIHHGDLPAAGKQRLRGGKADAAGGAGDDGGFHGPLRVNLAQGDHAGHVRERKGRAGFATRIGDGVEDGGSGTAAAASGPRRRVRSAGTAGPVSGSVRGISAARQ